MDDLEIEKFVDYVFKTPFGGILHLKNGAAIIIRGHSTEILPSLEEYHVKYKDNSSTWDELTNDQDKKKLYDANAAALAKIKWTDVEAVVDAAKKAEAAENRANLKAQGRSALNELVNLIVYFPFMIFMIWGLFFGMERYFAQELSGLQKSLIIGVGVVSLSSLVPKIPRRVAWIMAAIGYLLVILVLWKFD